MLDLGDVENAARALRQALSLADSDQLILANAGLCFYRAGEEEAALAAVIAARASPPPPDAQVRLSHLITSSSIDITDKYLFTLAVVSLLIATSSEIQFVE